MTGIVVTGHGQYAEGVMSAIRLVAGAPEQVQVVNFTCLLYTSDAADE